MSFYSEMAQVATELLTEFGSNLILLRDTSTFDPIQSVLTVDVTTELETVGVRLPDTSSYMKDSLAEGAIGVFVIDASNEPRLADKLVMGDDVYAITGIKSINPAGTPVAYICFIAQ